jgi:glutamate---cysteine ligase / carboxylate-amine ligase
MLHSLQGYVSASMDPSQHAFGSTTPFTLGVEEELFLVDPVTGDRVDASLAVLDRVGPIDGTVERELHACQVELITGVCATAGEAAQALASLRAAVSATGVGILGAGMHPSALPGTAEITDKDRYAHIRHLLGDAVADPTGGLHVHVGMPDAETAIKAFNALRRHLPLLQALGANSPFRYGRDTGLASAREVTMRGWPRSGVPRAMRDFEDFCTSSDLLCQAADVADYTWFWWKLRPHPRLGTVEIRALDAQTSLDDLASLVALTHCLARHAATAPAEPDPAPELLDEAAFRAARFGTAAELPGRDGTRRPVAVILDEVLAAVGPHAGELGCVDELDGIRRLVERGGGAGAQRSAYAIGGLGAMLRDGVARTTAAA